MAFEFAEANGIQHPFDGISRLAGRDYLDILKRNGTLSLKTPQAISLGRAIGVNEPQWISCKAIWKNCMKSIIFSREGFTTWMRAVFVQCPIN